MTCVLGFFALTFAVANRETDPLLIASEELQKKVDIFFLIAGVDQKTKSTLYLGTDWLKPIKKNQDYQTLIEEFKKTKKVLEQGFNERENQKTSSQTLMKAAKAAHVYFQQEKRLYLNLFRNVHQLTSGNESDFVSLKSLDLMLRSNVADTLFSHDDKFGAKYHLWHVRDSEGGFNQVEYGIVPSELSAMEQEAILSVPTQEGYQKGIQLMIARERMINRWSLKRMMGGVTDTMTYPSCGTELYSFKNLGSGDFYQSLWAQDRAEEISLMHADLAKGTLDAPLLGADSLRHLQQNYFNLFPSYRAMLSGKDDAILFGPSERQKEADYWLNTPQELIQKMESEWKVKSTIAMGAVNYPSDLVDANALAGRIAWISFYDRQKLVMDALTNEAVNHQIAEAQKNPNAAWNLSEKLVKETLRANQAQYISHLEQKILKLLKSDALISKIEKQRSRRFDTLLEKMKPAMNQAAQAGFVVADLERAVKVNHDSWLASGKVTHSISFDGWDKFQLGYIPMRGILSDHVALTNPSELRLFFAAKLQFWSGIDQWWRRLGKTLPLAVVPLLPGVSHTVVEGVKLAQQAKRISSVAIAIQNNPIVLRGIQTFFENLHEAYANELATRKLQTSELNESNSPLYPVLAQVAQASFVKFKSEVRVSQHKNRHVEIAPKTDFRIIPSQLDPRIKMLNRNNFIVADRTRVVKDQRIVIKKPLVRDSKVLPVKLVQKNHPSVPLTSKQFVAQFNRKTHELSEKLGPLPVSNLRVAAIDQTFVKAAQNPADQPEPSNFVDGEKAQAETIELYVQAFALMNLGEYVLGENRMVLYSAKSLQMIDNPLQMEHVLNGLSPESKLSRQLTHSLLDQKMAAEIIKNEKMAEQPLLGIRSAADVNLPTVADQLYHYYDPQHGVNIESVGNLTLNSVLVGIKNSPGLVEEACSADPIKKNQNFRNIFSGASSLRAAVIGNNRSFLQFDDELKREFRSNLEKFKDDFFDPLMSVVLWVTLIAALLYCAPGVASMIATGSFSFASFGVGAMGALQTLGAVSVKGILGTLMSSSVSKLVAWLFFSQLAVWSYVNCYEYPAFGDYQLKVAQAQMSGEHPQVVNSEVISFHEEIFERKLGTAVFAGMILVPEGFFIAKGALKVLGRPVASAIKRMEVAGGENAIRIAEEIKAPSLSTRMQQEGKMRGLVNHISEKASALKNLGRINTLAANVNSESLRQLLAANMSELISDDVVTLRNLYAQRATQINDEGARIMSAFRKNNLISKEASGAWSISPEMKNWVREKATKIGFKHTHYWKIVVAEDELEAMETGKLIWNQENQSEISGLVQFAYVKGLLAERDFLRQKQAILDVLIDAGQLNSKQILKDHFSLMSDSDWSRIESLFDAQAVHSDGRIAATLNSRWLSDSPALVNIRNTFRDYHRLQNEADLITKRAWGKEADEYFSSNANPANPDLLFENGQLKTNASPSGASARKYAEIFFDPDSFLAIPTSK